MSTYAEQTEVKEKSNHSHANSKSKNNEEHGASFVDNRPEAIVQKKIQKYSEEGGVKNKITGYETPKQLASKSVTNSKNDTYTVWDPSDIIADLTTPFKNWKKGQQDTSGHSAGQSKHVLASKYNTLANMWNGRNDKTAQKSVITFSTGGSLSGGKGVKHLKAVTFENKKRYSFVWHVSVVPD